MTVSAVPSAQAKEPAGLVQKDGKRPDGCTTLGVVADLWLGTSQCAPQSTVAASYVTATSQSAGAAAKQAAEKKCLKYAELSAAYKFQPVAVHTNGPMDEATISFQSRFFL